MPRGDEPGPPHLRTRARRRPFLDRHLTFGPRLRRLAAALASPPKALPAPGGTTDAMAAIAAERDSAEAARRAAEAEASAVLETISDGFCALDAAFRVTNVNRRALELYGRQREAVLGRVLFDAFPEINNTNAAAQLRAAMVQGQKREFRAESNIAHRWLGFTVHPRAGGGLLVCFRDVSARMADELSLRANEARMRLAQRIGGVATFDAALDSGLAFLSEQYAVIHGLPPGTTTGDRETMMASVHPEDRAHFTAALDAALAEGTNYEIAFRIIRPSDGAVRWLISRAEIFRDAAGRPQRYIGMVQDVTEWREAERRQAEALALLNSLLDNAPVGFAFFDRDHAYVRLNGFVARMCGLPIEAHLGRRVGDLLPHMAGRIDSVIDEVFRTGQPVYDVELEGEAPGEKGLRRHWLSGFYAVPDGSGAPQWVGAVVADITERRQQQEQLRRLNETLEARVHAEVVARQEAQTRLAHAERMQALGQLAGGIAHDFNNVLQAVEGNAGLIERRPGDEEAVRRHARRIMDAAGRGGSTTRRLLAFARRDELRAERVDVGPLLGGIREIVGPALGRIVTVQIACPSGLPPVLADRGQLETVLVNLAINARDAMPDGGTLRLSAAAESVADAAPHTAGLAAGPYVRIIAADTGHGMDIATAARATEPFFTTKEKGKGTGLGLAMARGFAEQSGGALAIRSEPGQGTSVTIWLPLAPHAGDPVPGDDAVLAPTAPARRILVVDDDELVRETLTAQLEDAGYTVLAAPGGAEALAVLDGGGRADLLLTDFSMPLMDGLTLIRAVRTRRADMPAILLTGYAGELAARAAPERFALLRKPTPESDLIARITALLEAG